MVDKVRRLIRPTPDGAFELDLDYFEYHTTAARSYSSRFVDLFGPARNPFEPIDLETTDGQRFADCAASVQRVLEDMLVGLTRALRAETGLPDLCLGGGVALNGVANARILAESGFERVFVPSAPGDAGCALGAALYADRVHFGNPDREVPDHPFWGPDIDDAELARVAGEDGQHVDRADDQALIAGIADDLAAGRIVGWMDGALELGPRALGHRSILASAASTAMRDRLNRDIKFRDEFRPFAPVVPVEAADRYFELPPGGTRLARFMSGVFTVRPEWRERLGAITHVDGTTRLQALDREMSPRLYALLEAYGRRTGIPVLLNTSFNLSGEPIVNRAVEGYSTFLRCGIDVLVAGNTRVQKKTRPHMSSSKEASTFVGA
jgi:carbamoyltransferase